MAKQRSLGQQLYKHNFDNLLFGNTNLELYECRTRLIQTDLTFYDIIIGTGDVTVKVMI